jgi:type IV secretory pathway TraG/TraD family ATPase VirD4
MAPFGMGSWANGGMVPLTAGAALLAIAFLRARGRPHMPKDRYRRGALLADGKRFQRRAARTGQLRIAGIAVPYADETKHFKVIGTTGTGKSTAIRELLRGAIARGDRAVFADPDGSYLSEFYDRGRGDVILNPFAVDSVKWDPFAEVRSVYDVNELASGLIPDSHDPSSSEWRGYARTLLSAVIGRCHADGRRDSADLWRLLTMAPVDELREIVAATPAQPFVDPENARMLGSIRSVMGSAIAAFEYIQTQRARAFSVRDWVRVRKSPGMLFVPYKAGQVQALRSMIAAWLHLAIFEAMSSEERRDQRLWFVVDELDALGEIHGLKDALARLRKFGGRCVLGFQSIAQVSSIYGQGEAQTLVENCSTTLILRCSGSENGGTSQFASRLIGDREVARKQVTRGSDRGAALFSRGERSSRSVCDQFVTEAAVMPSELEQLPDLCGYLKGASSPLWLKVTFRGPRDAARSTRPARRFIAP